MAKEPTSDPKGLNGVVQAALVWVCEGYATDPTRVP